MGRLHHGRALIAGLLAGSFLVYCGLSLPAHFRSVSPHVLAAAGRASLSPAEMIQDALDAGRTGVVRTILAAAPGAGTPSAMVALEETESAHPVFALTGGPAPYLEAFLQIPGVRRRPGGEAGVLPLFLPATNRSAMIGFLGQSSFASVRALLEVRRSGATMLFPHPTGAASHPWEATVLLAALLVQSESVPTAMAREWRTLAEGLAAGDTAATARFERIALSLLSLSQRLDWTTLAEVLRRLDSNQALEDLAALARRDEPAFRAVVVCGLLADQMAGVLRYQREGGATATEDLMRTFTLGQGAVRSLAALNLPIHEPSSFARALGVPSPWVTRTVVSRWVLHSPHAMLGAKGLLLFAGSWIFFFALGQAGALLGWWKIGSAGLRLARHAVGALCLSLLLLVLLDPQWLRLQDTSTGPPPVLLALIPTPFSVFTSQQNATMIDQATIIVLCFFAIVQFIVYLFGVTKIKEIRLHASPAATKLELLENEEVLFDLGLYVGLSGTVASLILLSMNIVEASLIAAYASTFFGIIFTAILKMAHLRPFRRRLILQNEALPSQPTP